MPENTLSLTPGVSTSRRGGSRNFRPRAAGYILLGALIQRSQLTPSIPSNPKMPVISDAPVTTVRETNEQRFNRLASQWQDETEHISSISKACMHPAYQRIIGMGADVVPILLRELRDNPDHWFWALNAITEEDPAEQEDTVDGAINAWLKWGESKGLI
jgi:hypothetical protein